MPNAESGRKVMDRTLLLSLRSRYAAALEVLDKAGHDEIDGDDDDSSSCLESEIVRPMFNVCLLSKDRVLQAP